MASHVMAWTNCRLGLRFDRLIAVLGASVSSAEMNLRGLLSDSHGNCSL